MGYAGRLEDKIEAQRLRKLGYSYQEILQFIPVSKDSISNWCRDIILTPEQSERLLNNRSYGQSKGSQIAAINKRQRRFEKIATINQESANQVGALSRRDRFIAGIALYAGEGDKGSGKSAFTNSNPNYINFMMTWFKEFCNIPVAKFRGAVWIHDDLDAITAKGYWSNLTGIPIAQFHKTYIAKNKPNSNKIRKNLHANGIFSIRFSDSDKQSQILGWISALVGGKIPQVP